MQEKFAQVNVDDHLFEEVDDNLELSTEISHAMEDHDHYLVQEYVERVMPLYLSVLIH